MSKIITRAPRSIWTLECLHQDGTPKWKEEYDNIVFDNGITDLLEKYFKGAGYTAAWYVGIVTQGGVFAAADTMSAHAGWAENIQYSQGNRPQLILGAMGNKTVNNTASKAQFTMNANATIMGTFLTTSPTKGGTTGVLYSAAAFLSGNKAVINGEILNASVVLSGS